MLTKVNYVDDTTVIHAKNLNDIQDAIIELQSLPAGGGVLSVNGKTPDDAGDVDLTAADVGAVAVVNNAGAHNAIYRGKNLGTSVTAEQYAAIADGSFADLYIGDYWVIGGVNYRIAAFDYYYLTGNPKCTTHLVTLVPDTSLYNAQYNDTNSTASGYWNSKMRTEGLNSARETISNAFGTDHLLYMYRGMSTVVSSAGVVTSTGWVGDRVWLMTEIQVAGCNVFGNTGLGTARAVAWTADLGQFPLFRHAKEYIHHGLPYWLTDVSGGGNFVVIDADTAVFSRAASSESGVRPTFSIYGGSV